MNVKIDEAYQLFEPLIVFKAVKFYELFQIHRIWSSMVRVEQCHPQNSNGRTLENTTPNEFGTEFYIQRSNISMV
jgi:hypothetical protein